MGHERKKSGIFNTISVPENVSPIPKAYVGSPKNLKLVFSFELYDRNEYFGVNPVCDGWTIRLFDELKNFSQYTLDDLENKKDKLRFHPLRNVHECPCPPPHNARYEDMEQLEIGSRRNGRIHFIRSENIIYIVWFDPLHNVYPSKGIGARKLKSTKQCLCDELESENERLHHEIDGLYSLLDVKTTP